ncbi:MAG: hypothetical protein EXS02_03445 [Planctomycetes bacterium]|nr:hypothetical protein [Planctomycetota bacterium]
MTQITDLDDQAEAERSPKNRRALLRHDTAPLDRPPVGLQTKLPRIRFDDRQLSGDEQIATASKGINRQAVQRRHQEWIVGPHHASRKEQHDERAATYDHARRHPE